MTEKSRKILIFSTSYLPHIGGAELAIKGITDQIDDYEFDLITARCDVNLPVWEKLGNVSVFRVGNGNRFDKFFLPVRGLKKAVKLHKEKNYDLTFASMASYGGLTARRLKNLFPEMPMLLNLQEGRDFGHLNLLKSYFFRRVVQSADVTVSISEHLKQVAIKNGFRENKISIIPNGVDTANFSQDFSYGELSELSDRLGVKPDEKVIVTASRLTHKNAIDDLIRALAVLTLQDTVNKYKLVIAGDGNDKKKLVELIHNLNIEDKVVFVGSISNHHLPKYLRIADVFVRPSRSEGLGSAFLEAMAAGIPVIATPVGGIPDFLKDGETGLFCKVGDPQSIAQQIKVMTSDVGLHNHIVKQAYRMVVKNYDWRRIAASYKEVFESLIK